MGVGGQRHPPGRFTPEKETRYPLCRRLGGSQGRSGRVQRVSPPPGFDPRTFVVSSGDKYCASIVSENFGIEKFSNLAEHSVAGRRYRYCSSGSIIRFSAMKTEVAHDDVHVKVFKIYGLCKLK
jgi:hypothetical protein